MELHIDSEIAEGEGTPQTDQLLGVKVKRSLLGTTKGIFILFKYFSSVSCLSFILQFKLCVCVDVFSLYCNLFHTLGS